MAENRILPILSKNNTTEELEWKNTATRPWVPINLWHNTDCSLYVGMAVVKDFLIVLTLLSNVHVEDA